MPSLKLRHIPLRLVTGAYILHAGMEKRNVDEQHATGLHGMASGAFPSLKSIPPSRFASLLSSGEMATGAALLLPFVPIGLAGAALTGFSGSLVALYMRTPALRKTGSIWPSENGIAVSKDVWMLGIGLSLLLEAAAERRTR